MALGSYRARAAHRTRKTRLALTLTLAYTAVIVYASLQPFSGWRLPPREILEFLIAPRPRYLDAADMALNFAAYLPLGVLAFVALKRRFGATLAILLAAGYGTGLSLAMESVQMFLASRIASNIDLLLNASGALLGAALGWLFTAPRAGGRLMEAVRTRYFVRSGLADVGLTLTLLWLIAQLHPSALVFATGDVRASWPLPLHLAHTPWLFTAIEATVVAANVASIGLMLSLWLQRDLSPLRATLAVVFTAFAVKTLSSAWMLKSANLLNWLTPGTALGASVGFAILAAVLRLPVRARAATAALALAFTIAAVNIAPENPYQTLPPYLVAAEPAQVARLATLLHVLSDVWPFVAIVYLAVAAIARPADRDTRPL